MGTCMVVAVAIEALVTGVIIAEGPRRWAPAPAAGGKGRKEPLPPLERPLPVGVEVLEAAKTPAEEV